MFGYFIKSKLDTDEVIERIEIAGGYLNFYINKLVLAKTVLEEINSKKDDFGDRRKKHIKSKKKPSVSEREL